MVFYGNTVESIKIVHMSHGSECDCPPKC